MLNVIKALFSTYPLQTLLYASKEMLRTVEREINAGSYDLVHTQLARMAPFVAEFRNVPRVIDLIDALSINMQRRSLTDRGPMRWVAHWEWLRLLRYERRICKEYDHVTVVSSSDRDAIGEFNNLHINPNGVDLAGFERSITKREETTLIFTGNMGYFPNADAAVFFVEEILPLIRRVIPDVKFNIVGVNPTGKVRRLAKDRLIEVTGSVPDIGRYLAVATVAVCPMRSGSGMQFKVIEAMAAGTPVVATPFALGGLDVVDGEHLLVAKNTTEFAELVVSLLLDKTSRARLEANARQLVRERYSWEVSVEALERLYQKAIGYHSNGKSRTSTPHRLLPLPEEMLPQPK